MVSRIVKSRQAKDKKLRVGSKKWKKLYGLPEIDTPILLPDNPPDDPVQPAGDTTASSPTDSLIGGVAWD